MGKRQGKMGFYIMDMKLSPDRDTTNEIMVGSYYVEDGNGGGGCDFEIALKWRVFGNIGSNEPPVLHLGIYADAMPFTARFQPLIDALGELAKEKRAKSGVWNKFDISPEEVLIILKKLRYKNFDTTRKLVA